MVKYDLHVHTNLSDSDMSPKDTIEHASKLDNKLVALTDHDTLASFKVAKALDGHQGVRVIGGVEISVFDPVNKRRVHILGYGVDTECARLRQLCDNITKSRKESIDESLAILRKLGLYIDDQVLSKLTGVGGVYKQHIVHYLADGNNKQLYNKIYRELFSRNGGKAFVPVSYPDCREAIGAINEANGVASVAHMMAYKNDVFLPEMIEAGLSAVEVRHSSHSKDDEKKLLDICKKHHLIATCGSDWHGYYGEHDCKIGDLTMQKQYLSSFLDSICMELDLL